MTQKEIPKVALRGGFSDRMGIQVVNTEIQMEDFDERTRVAIVNLIDALYDSIFELDYNRKESTLFFLNLLREVYVEQVSYNSVFQANKKRLLSSYVYMTIHEDTYDAVLTVLEYVAEKFTDVSNRYMRQINVYDLFNSQFEIEYVGYRFVNKKIVPITSDVEIKEINDALSSPYDNVNKHLDKAIKYLSDRHNPDYENSIKESISAVEAMCSNILGKRGSLGDTIKIIEKEKIVYIHPALKEAFLKLYGYTSDDESGIRHASELGGKDATFSEARYMVVSCSAFINYLKMNIADENCAEN